MKRNVVLTGLLVVFATASLNYSAAAEEKLYKRLGGYDAIAAVVDDFLGRLAEDKQTGRFFVGQSTDSLKKIRQHIVDMLVEASGGPAHYVGRTMKQSHEGLKITEDDWNVMLKHFGATGEKFKIPGKEAGEVLALFNSVKKDIVAGGK